MWPALTCRLIFSNGVSISTNSPPVRIALPWKINHIQADKRPQYIEDNVPQAEFVSEASYIMTGC